MPASSTLAAGPLRPGTATASPTAATAPQQAAALRGLPDDIKLEVIDKLVPKDQTRLIVADRHSWQLSRKYPALSADSRQEKYLQTHIPMLFEAVKNRLETLRYLRSGGCMYGVCKGHCEVIARDLQQISLLLQRPLEATAEYPVSIMAHQRLAQRIQLENLQYMLRSLQMQTSYSQISLLFHM